MTTFDDREHAFEAHFAFEEELEFKVRARRDRLVAQWAGGLMNLQGDALEAYVLSVMRADLREANVEEVYQKVLADLADHGVSVGPQEVHARIDQMMMEARAQIGGVEIADRLVG